MKEVLISFIVALFIGAALNGLPKESPKQSASGGGQAAPQTAGGDPPMNALAPDTGDEVTNPQEEAGVPELSQDKFTSEVLESKQPVLVDFYADWCGPCKQMAPVVAKIAKQYSGRAKFVKVNIDRNPELVSKYNIQSIPTFIIFKGGASADTFAGSMPRADLTAALEKHLN